MSHIPLNKGTFLVANPELQQGIYYQSVVLLCEFTPMGSFGLMINKPCDAEMQGDIPLFDNLPKQKIQFRLGGSIQPSQIMLLHTCDKHPDQTLPILDGVFLGGDVDFLQNALQSDNCPEILLCFGYTGWAAGDLEKEVSNEHWYPTTGSRDWVFSTTATSLWQTALSDMGKDFRHFTQIPDDLTQN